MLGRGGGGVVLGSGVENDTDYFKVLLQEGDRMLVGAK